MGSKRTFQTPPQAPPPAAPSSGPSARHLSGLLVKVRQGQTCSTWHGLWRRSPSGMGMRAAFLEGPDPGLGLGSAPGPVSRMEARHLPQVSERASHPFPAPPPHLTSKAARCQEAALALALYKQKPWNSSQEPPPPLWAAGRGCYTHCGFHMVQGGVPGGAWRDADHSPGAKQARKQGLDRTMGYRECVGPARGHTARPSRGSGGLPVSQ